MKTVYTPEVTTQTLWVLVGDPWAAVFIWLAAMNILAFALMGADKARAKKQNARRIPERRLFLAAALGGSVGAILGMRFFRHKTERLHFVWGMPAIALAQLTVLVCAAVFF